MPDVVSPAVRSRMMAGIKSKNTLPEMTVRRLLHRHGFRFRLHKKSLPGRPDLVLQKHRAVIFVHGCFWHGHDCHLFKLPKTRTSFWQSKIATNSANDIANRLALAQLGWRVLTIWECALKGRQKLETDFLAKTAVEWLKNGDASLEIRGTST